MGFTLALGPPKTASLSATPTIEDTSWPPLCMYYYYIIIFLITITIPCSFYDVEGGFNPDDFVPPDFCWCLRNYSSNFVFTSWTYFQFENYDRWHSSYHTRQIALVHRTLCCDGDSCQNDILLRMRTISWSFTCAISGKWSLFWFLLWASSLWLPLKRQNDVVRTVTIEARIYLAI